MGTSADDVLRLGLLSGENERLPSERQSLMEAEGIGWLTSSLEQATTMVPPTERHAIHKLWMKMEDAVDGK